MKNWFPVALAMSGLLLGACSSDDASSGGDDTPPECTFTPLAEVRSTLADDTTAEPTSDRRNPSVNVCAYAQRGIDAQVIIRYEVDLDAESFAASKKAFNESGQPTTDISGVGDEAFTSSLTLGDDVFTSLMVRKGSKGLQIVNRAPLDKIETLATSILARF